MVYNLYVKLFQNHVDIELTNMICDFKIMSDGRKQIQCDLIAGHAPHLFPIDERWTSEDE